MELDLRTNIYKFEDIENFKDEFKICSSDLLVISRRVYSRLFPEGGPQAIFKEDYVSAEPTAAAMGKILEKTSKMSYERVFGIGGGSVLDMAKIVSLGYDDVDWMYAHKDELKRAHGLVLAPTTCGTGSEVTNISVLNFEDKGQKIGLVSDELYPDSAVLLPSLLSGMPDYVFATSSIDALIHATESYLSPFSTEYTRMFSVRAIEKIIAGYEKIVSDEDRERLLGDFLVASNFAGIAFGTAGCGAVHALSFPLGGKYKIAHGESNYILLFSVLDFYDRFGGERLEDLKSLYGRLLGCGASESFEKLSKLLSHFLERRTLAECGVSEGDIEEFSANVLSTQTRLLKKAYVRLERGDIENIYSSAYGRQA